VIENRPGAGTVIGTEAVARSAPDGSTLLITSPPFVINPHLRRVNYDPQISFEPICTLAVTPTMIVVSGGSPYRTLSDLLDEARAKPGEMTMASIGPGTGSHIAFEMLVHLANIKMTFVPYPGTAPAVGALLGEHVTSAFTDYPTAAEHVKAGRLRALAVASPSRIASLPDVPTVAESGFKDYDADLGTESSPRRRLRRIRSRNWKTGSPRRCRRPSSSPSLPSRDSILLEYVVLNLAPTSAENSRNTAASFATRISGRPSNCL
jgi:hypothetical protein